MIKIKSFFIIFKLRNQSNILYTGNWNSGICGTDWYYVCEKPRIGYSQPTYTTPDPSIACAVGWDSDPTLSYCYRVCIFKLYINVHYTKYISYKCFKNIVISFEFCLVKIVNLTL